MPDDLHDTTFSQFKTTRKPDMKIMIQSRCFIKIITFISLIFFIFTSHSYAEWIKYLSTEIGDDFYINAKSIETKGKFVFYQSLSNYTKKPLKSGPCRYPELKGKNNKIFISNPKLVRILLFINAKNLLEK